jgi:hypothetical protein
MHIFIVEVRSLKTFSIPDGRDRHTHCKARWIGHVIAMSGENASISSDEDLSGRSVHIKQPAAHYSNTRWSQFAQRVYSLSKTARNTSTSPNRRRRNHPCLLSHRKTIYGAGADVRFRLPPEDKCHQNGPQRCHRHSGNENMLITISGIAAGPPCP